MAGETDGTFHVGGVGSNRDKEIVHYRQQFDNVDVVDCSRDVEEHHFGICSLIEPFNSDFSSLGGIGEDYLVCFLPEIPVEVLHYFF